ncbi:MAG: hypothetical protein GX489_06645 [Firmicutes bacterium]|jgi:carbamoyl-phosphate synthase small subunit|nr:hypothetical protein [Bacillota bacterium]
MLATVTLENGLSFSGEMFGAAVPAWGEIVFHTGMVDYERVLTDKCYDRKVVVMTYPLVGNCGLGKEQMKKEPVIAGLIVADICQQPQHWGRQRSISEYLQYYGIPGLSGVDTRALLRTVQMTGGTARASLIPALWTQSISRLSRDQGNLDRKDASFLVGRKEQQSA